MELRAYTFIDSLQPQLAGFIQTVSQGFLPLDGQAALFVEVAPGIAVNQLTDAALKRTRVEAGMQIVERAYGLIEVHARDQGEVRAAGAAMLERAGASEDARLRPKVLAVEAITGVLGMHSALVNRMRHGDMLRQGRTLYTLEVQPAAYVAIAANQAEKASDVQLLEVVTFGAVGRLWLGGREEDVAQAGHAIDETLESIGGRA